MGQRLFAMGTKALKWAARVLGTLLAIAALWYFLNAVFEQSNGLGVYTWSTQDLALGVLLSVCVIGQMWISSFGWGGVVTSRG